MESVKHICYHTVDPSTFKDVLLLAVTVKYLVKPHPLLLLGVLSWILRIWVDIDFVVITEDYLARL